MKACDKMTLSHKGLLCHIIFMLILIFKMWDVRPFVITRLSIHLYHDLATAACYLTIASSANQMGTCEPTRLNK